MNGARRQRGIALLIALLTVALAAVMIAGLLDRGELALARTRNALRGEQAEAYAQGLEAYAARVLLKDFDQGEGDSNTDLWAMPLPPQVVPGGTIRASMRDLNGCFNLNNLAPAPAAADVEARCSRACSKCAASMLRLQKRCWTGSARRMQRRQHDRCVLPRAAGAVPERTARVRARSELRLVRGVTSDVYARLAPYVCALPVGSPSTSTPRACRCCRRLVRTSAAQAESLWQNGQAHFETFRKRTGQGSGTPSSISAHADRRREQLFPRAKRHRPRRRAVHVLQRDPGAGLIVVERSRGSDAAPRCGMPPSAPAATSTDGAGRGRRSRLQSPRFPQVSSMPDRLLLRLDSAGDPSWLRQGADGRAAAGFDARLAAGRRDRGRGRDRRAGAGRGRAADRGARRGAEPRATDAGASVRGRGSAARAGRGPAVRRDEGVGDAVGVAVVARAKLRAWLERSPRTASVPMSCCPNRSRCRRARSRDGVVENDRALVRLAPSSAFACAPSELAAWLQRANSDGTARPLDVFDFRDGAAARARRAGASYQERQRDPLAFLARSLRKPPLNLLDGEFAPQHRAARGARWWRVAAALAAAVVALAVLDLGFEVLQLSRTSARIDAAAQDAVRKAFPDVDGAELARAYAGRHRAPPHRTPARRQREQRLPARAQRDRAGARQRRRRSRRAASSSATARSSSAFARPMSRRSTPCASGSPRSRASTSP